MVVYAIINLLNNKIYIGQTKLALHRRYPGGFTKRPANEHLKHAYNKYGVLAFTIMPLKFCSSLDELDYWENYYIKYYKSYDRKTGYNKEFGGNLNKTPTKETLEKMSKVQKKLCENLEWKNSLKERSDNYWNKKENRKIKSDHMKALCNTKDRRLAMSLERGGKPFQVIEIKTGNIIGTWINKSICAEDLHIDHRHISCCLKGNRRSHKGYKFLWL